MFGPMFTRAMNLDFLVLPTLGISKFPILLNLYKHKATQVKQRSLGSLMLNSFAKDLCCITPFFGSCVGSVLAFINIKIQEAQLFLIAHLQELHILNLEWKFLEQSFLKIFRNIQAGVSRIFLAVFPDGTVGLLK
jgi:hypothetical protein